MAKPLQLKNANASELSTELAQTQKAKEVIEAKIKSLQDSIAALTKSEENEVKDRKATLLFSEEAWLTMIMLVRDNSKEIAWHGVSRRLDDPERPDTYYIERLLVYPQKVTAATVTFDQEKYEAWLNTLDDDTFNNLHAQFHSHVNMGTFPSSTDTEMYTDTLALQPEDSYYIFGIWNKKDAHWLKIVDFRENIVFDNTDITVKYEYDEGSILGIVIAARDAVEEKVWSSPKSTSYSGGSFNSYQNNKPSDEKLDSTAKGSASSGNTNIIPIHQGDTANDKKKKDKKGKKGKGKPVPNQYDDDSQWDDLPLSEYADSLFGMGYAK